jgi:hypothetical protein
VIRRLSILFLFGATAAVGSAEETDRRTFDVAIHANSPAVASVYVQLADEHPGTPAVYRLTDSLYLRAIPLAHAKVERGAFAYSFSLARDAAGEKRLRPTDQPAHGPSEDVLRAADFRNGDNTGPNQVGPENVNAAGEFREIEFEDHALEIRVLSFEIVGLGPSRIPAFSRLSCLVTIRATGR